MKYVRIIPRLDIKGPNLVKGIHLEGLRVLGKPEEFARLYYEQGADELIYIDTVASLYNRNNLTDILSRTAENIFIPLTVGGGIRSLSDINEVLRSGADKISINTGAINNPKFIDEASRTFGSSTIVVSIEVIKQRNGQYLAYTDNGREFTGVEILSWAKEVQERGAGEILLTSIDQEGTGNGYELDLINLVSSAVTIPVIAHGGAGSIADIVNAVQLAGADAVAIASMLHYGLINKNRNTSNQFQDEGNIEFLTNKNTFKMFGSDNLSSIKKQIAHYNVLVRGILNDRCSYH
ncbi:imidazole glycerol phosphate synthase subunit HisF [Candidatus Poribacteria bacterium]|nr:imidazole glycerol phosphate synthase subunit HisF [Candidatus Poribacteria bacterium]